MFELDFNFHDQISAWYTSELYQLNHFPAYNLFSMGQGSLLCTVSLASKTNKHKVAHMEGIYVVLFHLNRQSALLSHSCQQQQGNC